MQFKPVTVAKQNSALGQRMGEALAVEIGDGAMESYGGNWVTV